MKKDEKLKGKKLIIVDDEPDVLEILEEMLDMCVIDKASDFQSAKEFLDKNIYDAAVLDIMGVQGLDLLEITNKKQLPTLMLTAHAVTPESFVKSIEKGALAYIPKEKITEIGTFLIDMLEAHERGTTKFGKWFDRLEPFFEKKFGMYWKQRVKDDPDFWKKYI